MSAEEQLAAEISNPNDVMMIAKLQGKLAAALAEVERLKAQRKELVLRGDIANEDCKAALASAREYAAKLLPMQEQLSAALAAQRKAEEERDEARAVIADVCAALDVGRSEPFDVKDLAPVAKKVLAMAFDTIVQERAKLTAAEKALAEMTEKAERHTPTNCNADEPCITCQLRNERDALLSGERAADAEIDRLRDKLTAVEAQCAAMRSVIERFLDENGNGVTIAEMRAALATKGEG